MVSLWWGQTPLDELIEKATSELLPANQEDVALQFMISDQIRSKKVNAKDAMRCLHKRLQHKNPNVQMATLSLTDTCVKNGGDQFVREIASREFMEGISSIVHSSSTDYNVRIRTLSILQTWAIAAKNTPSLSYLTDTYNLFRAEGISFPQVQEPVNSFLLETIAPPEWTDSDVCERCRTPFTLTNRKHHCRNCGGTFCQECSSKSLPLPHMAIDEAVRVCYGCYIKLKLSRVAKKDGPLPPYPGAPQQQSAAAQAAPSLVRVPTAPNHSQPTTTTTTDNNNNNNNNVEDTQFEEDLKKALELSKIEAEKTNGYGGYSTSSHYNNVESNKTAEREQTSSLMNNNNNNNNNQQQQQQQQQSKEQEEGEDPELAAAIAASLKDMEDAQKSTFEYYSNQKAPTTTITTIGGKSDELTSVEMENIELFSLLMHRINDSGNTIGNDDQINRLYTQIGTLQPKLVKNLDEASQKYQKFAELHEKLNMSVKKYDQLLQQRVANSYYNRGTFLSTGTQSYASAQYPATPTSPIQQQQPTSSLYPTMQPPTNKYQSTYTMPTHSGAPNAPAVPYSFQSEQQQQQYGYVGSPASNQQQQQPIQLPLTQNTSQPQYNHDAHQQSQQPQQSYPQLPQQPQQPEQSMYPSVPSHIPTPHSSQPQQSVQQSRSVEETPLIDL